MKNLLLLLTLTTILASCTKEMSQPTTPAQPPTVETTPTTIPAPEVAPTAPVTPQ